VFTLGSRRGVGDVVTTFPLTNTRTDDNHALCLPRPRPPCAAKRCLGRLPRPLPTPPPSSEGGVGGAVDNPHGGCAALVQSGQMRFRQLLRWPPPPVAPVTVETTPHHAPTFRRC